MPGDIILLRGAALYHKAGRWTGDGRFIIAPFCDRRLFHMTHVARPREVHHIYGPSWRQTRVTYKYQSRLPWVSQKEHERML